MYFIELIDGEIAFQRHMLKQYSRLRRLKTDGTLGMSRKDKRYREYYIRYDSDNIRRFVRKKDMDRVAKIQAQATGAAGAARAEENLRLLGELKAGYRPCDFASVQSDLDEKYHFIPDVDRPWVERVLRRTFPQSENPGYIEELRHSTSFGLILRSKNEAQIAEMLMAAGLEFYYEKSLHLKTGKGRYQTFHPDFTIMMPDGRALYWEHKGLMDDLDYLKRDAWRMHVYHRNGIFQPHNLIVTCDGPKGEFPGTEIAMIIERLAAMAGKSRV